MHNFALNDAVYLHIHSTKKFRTETVSVSFIRNLDESDAAISFLLSYLLADSCGRYPGKRQVLNRLDELYGASFSVSNDPFGNADRLSFSISGIALPAFFPDYERIYMETLAAFIFEPRLENGVFPEAMFQECVEQAVIAVEEERDDPFSLTLETASRGYGGTAAKKLLPTIEELRSLTSGQCADYWETMRSTSRVDIQVLGDTDETECFARVRELFPFGNGHHEPTVIEPHHGNESLQYIHKDVPQSHMIFLYETGIYSGDELLPVLILGNGVFGSLPVSLLFRNVREKLGLCYSIESRMLSYDGALRVSAACSSSAVSTIHDAIMNEFERMKNGAFSDEELEVARRMTISAYRSAKDIPSAILAGEYRRALIPHKHAEAAMLERYLAVKREEIASVFSNMKLCSTAVLCKGEERVL